MKRICLLFFLFTSSIAYSQDTLPKFSVMNVGNNRYIIGWVNTFGLVKQISIQRSHDSLRNFTTIMSVPDPNARENGFADTKSPNDHMFYRLFVVLDQGRYFFTESRKPVLDTMRISRSKTIYHIKDSSANGGIKPIVPKKPEFIPSFYVYTNKDGYVFINLPDAEKKKYRIKFFDDAGSFLFEIKSIKETGLTLDKANFLHAGWFNFELYDNEALVEKNKFYLAKEF